MELYVCIHTSIYRYEMSVSKQFASSFLDYGRCKNGEQYHLFDSFHYSQRIRDALVFFNETDFSITETNLCLRRHTPSILMDRILQSASLPFYLKEQVKLPGFI